MPSPEPELEPDAEADPPVDAARRSSRVAQFDDLGALATDANGGSGAPRVARFDGLDEGAGAETRVAAFDGLGRGRADPGTVVALDGDLGRAGGRSRRPAEPRPPDRSGGHDVPPAAPSADDGPPDAPLPGNRRRGARTRRGSSGTRDRTRSDRERPDSERSDPDADPVAVAREICLRLLTDRARTRQELAQALARKGVPDDATATVLDRFDEVGLIDDAAFAGQWVRSRHAHRGLGRRAIALELRRKGVADDVAGEALAEVDAESEERRARELVDRKLRSLTVSTAEQRASAARRLVGMLARKGYGAGTAYRVVREALAEHGAEVHELGAADSLDE